MDPARRLRVVPEEPLALHDRAADDLRFIRRTLERSGEFTAVPGAAFMGMGVVAVAAALLARGAPPERWVATWMGAAVVAFALALAGVVRKSRRLEQPVLRGPGRKFLLGTLPAVVAGALLTLPLLRAGAVDLLPGVWLLLYGTAVLGGGTSSIRIVPALGLAFMAVGAVALAAPSFGGEAMALGFGGLHLGFGAVIWRKYGG